MNGDSEQKNKNIDARIVKRYVLKGTVKLESPLLIGGGEGNAFIDINILKDSNGNPLIPGTSLAGVLLAMSEEKYKIFFGKMSKEKEKSSQDTQSILSIDDITLKDSEITVRDGVKINRDTGVAEDKAKFDYEAVERGAKGNFKMTLTIRERFKNENSDEFIKILAGMLRHGIFLGSHTTKGFGKICTEQISLDVYDYSMPEDVKAWLQDKPCPSNLLDGQTYSENEIAENSFSVEADFVLNSSLIVRTSRYDETYSDVYVDLEKIAAVQLLSNGDYVIPGSSIRGVICQRAEEILKACGSKNYENALKFLFGFASENQKEYTGKKSRLAVEECYISRSNGNVKHCKQTRNKIDRFTGGTIEGALFEEIPIWNKKGSSQPYIKLRFMIKDCQPWEAGLMMFVLKDLWQSDLAIGGEKSIGRGTLKGIKAKIIYKTENIEAELKEENGKIKISGYSMEKLENLAKAFKTFAEAAK
ncbi:MAG: hypothetical protein J5706_08065 [Elusimicrobiales bacterium]|nr:hypothetical protein [Elusimicrobiales bacterium]